MGAVVNIRLKPGQDPNRLKDRLQKELQAKTGQTVSIQVSIQAPQQQSYSSSSFNPYLR